MRESEGRIIYREAFHAAQKDQIRVYSKIYASNAFSADADKKQHLVVLKSFKKPHYSSIGCTKLIQIRKATGTHNKSAIKPDNTLAVQCAAGHLPSHAVAAIQSSGR